MGKSRKRRPRRKRQSCVSYSPHPPLTMEAGGSPTSTAGRAMNRSGDLAAPCRCWWYDNAIKTQPRYNSGNWL